MTEQDIRWQQRYQQYNKAFALLKMTVAQPQLSVIERAGLIQFFEMTFELSWKLLKDYQEAEGFAISSPRNAIKQAFQNGLITDGHLWIKALEDRNLTTHTYNEETALAVEQKIRQQYFALLDELDQRFIKEIES